MSKLMCQILGLHEVESAVNLKKSSLYAMIRRGEFPAQVSLGRRKAGWRSTDIEQWIESRISMSSGGWEMNTPRNQHACVALQ
jgi:prophage regulatory protein